MPTDPAERSCEAVYECTKRGECYAESVGVIAHCGGAPSVRRAQIPAEREWQAGDLAMVHWKAGGMEETQQAIRTYDDWHTGLGVVPDEWVISAEPIATPVLLSEYQQRIEAALRQVESLSLLRDHPPGEHAAFRAARDDAASIVRAALGSTKPTDGA